MRAGKFIITVFLMGSLTCGAQEMKAGGQTATTAAPAQPLPATSAPPSVTPSNDTSSTYVIGASDVLSVTVWKETTLSGTMLVRPDGMISMPLVGDIRAAGLTPQQLSNEIATRLEKFILAPHVSVVLSEIHSKVVYTLGEVGKKGPIEMTPGMTLLQAISSAGGLTDYANKKKIYILRSEAGNQVKIPVRYKQALKGDGKLNLVLQPGDTIVVP